MATVRVNRGSSGAQTTFGQLIPVLGSKIRDGQTIVSSGASQATTIQGATGEIWDVVVTGGDIWLTSGVGTPVAEANKGWLVLAGERIQLGVSAEGEKLAVIDA